MSYTPGPWSFTEAGNESFIVVHPNKNILARISFSPKYMKDQQLNYEEGKANAKLIAAAPELLEACQSIFNSMNESANMSIAAKEHYKEAMDKCLAAIKKVTT